MRAPAEPCLVCVCSPSLAFPSFSSRSARQPALRRRLAGGGPSAALLLTALPSFGVYWLAAPSIQPESIPYVNWSADLQMQRRTGQPLR